MTAYGEKRTYNDAAQQHIRSPIFGAHSMNRECPLLAKNAH